MIRAGLLLAGFMILVIGCAEIRLLTYPSEFVYLDDEGVQDTMQQMSRSLRKLDQLVSETEGRLDASERRSAVSDELKRLETFATALGVGSALEVGEREPPRTNHLLIDEHIDVFLADVARARRFVTLEPPNYYHVGTLVGSCQGCHEER